QECSGSDDEEGLARASTPITISSESEEEQPAKRRVKLRISKDDGEVQIVYRV
ncbi:unnamed protein product, partial [Ceratitis capitata]